MSDDKLDRDFPQGNPDSTMCRWCHGLRVIRRGTFRLCYRCDTMTRPGVGDR